MYETSKKNKKIKYREKFQIVIIVIMIGRYSHHFAMQGSSIPYSRGRWVPERIGICFNEVHFSCFRKLINSC
jgi:hypothetical protein